MAHWLVFEAAPGIIPEIGPGHRLPVPQSRAKVVDIQNWFLARRFGAAMLGLPVDDVEAVIAHRMHEPMFQEALRAEDHHHATITLRRWEKRATQRQEQKLAKLKKMQQSALKPATAPKKRRKK